MSGPSAIANPMSAKIVVNSSITWLSGWIRPASAGVSRSGSVTSMVSDAAARRARRISARRAARRAPGVTASLARLIAAPCVLRSSGDILPSVASSAEIEPFLPSAATRTASSAPSSSAAAIWSRMVFFERCEVGHGQISAYERPLVVAIAAPKRQAKSLLWAGWRFGVFEPPWRTLYQDELKEYPMHRALLQFFLVGRRGQGFKRAESPACSDGLFA